MTARTGSIELLGSDPQYRETWQAWSRSEERLPDWVMNLTGSAEQMNAAVTEDGDQYLVGPLCETAQNCLNKRLIVASASTRTKPTRCW